MRTAAHEVNSGYVDIDRGSKCCPIAGTPCPGSCVYADVVARVGLGIVVFDLKHSSLLFCNIWASNTLAELGPISFAFLAKLLLRRDRGVENLSNQSHSLQIGARLVGYSDYYNERFAWVLLRDITEKARLESIAESVETMNNLGYIFSAVRHEIGNPINSIKIALSVLEANLERFSQTTLLEYIYRMSSEIGRMEHLLRSLRSFSLFERPEARCVDAATFLSDFLSLIGCELERRQIRLLQGECDGIQIYCDPRALQQVMLNLVTNACDALVGRSSPFIAIRFVKLDSLVFVYVEDNGCGIPKEECRQIFKPFHTTKVSGTGLGLVIARKLLAAMNGTLSVESIEGEGTTFSLSLPACPKVDAGADC